MTTSIEPSTHSGPPPARPSSNRWSTMSSITSSRAHCTGCRTTRPSCSSTRSPVARSRTVSTTPNATSRCSPSRSTSPDTNGSTSFASPTAPSSNSSRSSMATLRGAGRTGWLEDFAAGDLLAITAEFRSADRRRARRRDDLDRGRRRQAGDHRRSRHRSACCVRRRAIRAWPAGRRGRSDRVALPPPTGAVPGPIPPLADLVRRSRTRTARWHRRARRFRVARRSTGRRHCR